MITYGLKLWSNNIMWFDEALERYKNGEFDFVEVYSNSDVPHEYTLLQTLKAIPIQAVHIGHLDNAGFHNFFLTNNQKNAWKMTTDLADFFDAPRIIVHPAVVHTRETFWENIDKLNDERIVVESMPVVSPLGGPERIFGSTLEDLRHIAEKKPVCIDIEKIIKAAVYYSLDYKTFVSDVIEQTQSVYFHISGGNITDPIDQHTNLWEAGFDVAWVHSMLETYARQKAQDVSLLFETPKTGNTLENDMKNMAFFKQAL